MSSSNSGIPIIDPLRYLMDNYEKLREFEEYESRSSSKSSSRQEAKDLKNYILVQILE